MGHSDAEGGTDRNLSLSERRAPLWSHVQSVGTIASGLARAVVRARQGRRDLQELARDLASRELHVHAAVVPPLVTGMVEALRHWGLGCPMEADDGTPLFPIQAALCYAPLLRRMRGGKPDRDAEHSALVNWATRHRARFDAVITGMTSVGMLGDEPVYQDPAHLAEDVRVLEGLGYGDIALYSLEGLLFGDDGDPGADHAPRRGVDDWLAAAFGESLTATARAAE